MSPDLNIQGETHDSIEDARTALQLYRKYLDLSRGGGADEVRKALKGLYEKGRKMDWKVPESDGADAGQGSPKSTRLLRGLGLRAPGGRSRDADALLCVRRDLCRKFARSNSIDSGVLCSPSGGAGVFPSAVSAL